MAGTNNPHRLLAAHIRGEVIAPGDPFYDEARSVWNARFDRRPVAIVLAHGPDDVAAALEHAATLDLPVAVRAGGHSPAGWSSSEGGLVIDLRRLEGIDIQTDGTVIVGGGVTAGQLVRRLDMQGFGLPVGTCAGVGVAGLTLGGGIGHLNGRHGLTCDNLCWAEIVLADGSTCIAAADREPDLFWALCGAGANFGVATRLCFRAVPVSTGFGGAIAFRDCPIIGVVRAFAELCDGAPDDLGAELRLFDDGSGAAATVSIFWTGNQRLTDEVVGPLRRLGEPAAGDLGPVRYAALALFDEGGPRRAYYQRSANLPRLDEKALAEIVERGDCPEDARFMVLIHRRHGAAARITGGAYPHRSAAFETTFVAAWAAGRAAADLCRRVDLAWQAVGGEALPVYVNMLDDEEPSRILAAYGASHMRLRRLKARYDGHNRFRSNANIAPLPEPAGQ